LGKLGQMALQKDGYITALPGLLSGWTAMRDVPTIPKQTFREWWEERERA
jgi:L-lactate dehydrogenase complex protein LldF